MATLLDPETAIDIAYDIFLEMASDNLEPADIMLFNLQFEERGAVEVVPTSDKWDEEIGVLIDPEAFTEVWIGLLGDNDEFNDIFAKVLLAQNEENEPPQVHIIWKE